MSGGPFQGPDDVLVDDYIAPRGMSVGDSMEILNHSFRVAGIVENAAGEEVHSHDYAAGIDCARISTVFYVKLDNPPTLTPWWRSEESAGNGEILRAVDPGLPQHMTPSNLPVSGPLSGGHRGKRGDWVPGHFSGDLRRSHGAHPRDRHLKRWGSKFYIVNVVLRETILLAVADPRRDSVSLRRESDPAALASGAHR